MNPEVNIEHQVRMALGDLTLQLIAARAEIESLRARLTAAEAPAKTNGKGKEPKDEAQPRPQ